MAQLTRSQRDQLQALTRTGLNQQQMADIIGCDQSTVSRELDRNGSPIYGRYTANTAEQRAVKRRKQAYRHRARWYDSLALRQHIETELRDGRSPDQISGRLKREGLATISHTTVYTYIGQDKERGGDLYRCLNYQGKKFKWRGIGGDGRGSIPNRQDISQRPAAVAAKERSGDWESDLVVSNQRGKGAVATFVERTCLYFRAVLVTAQTAEEMVRASKQALADIPERLRLTMTHDNGREISRHEQITEEIGIAVYCARPYRSCDRGLNEWYNRELRRFFPKGTDFSRITQTEVDFAVDWLNNCPRRSLDYRTPKEAFEEQVRIMHFTV